MENYQKLDYILDSVMNATEVTQAFGFKSENMISKMRKGKSNITQLHIDGLEKCFNIPSKIFTTNIDEENEIDEIIKRHQLKKEKLQKKEARQKKILATLEQEGLIPPNILNQELNEEELVSIIKKHKKSFQTNTKESQHIKHASKIFPDNNKLFKKLKGVWYGYLYPSNPASAEHGIWEVKTIIHDDHSVVDEPWGNRGYIKLGKHESMIIKESYDNDDLTFIRFSNRQVPSQHFRFVIISNQNNTHREMVNFGFFSRKQYSPDEAKEILGDINSKQLKLDVAFNDRLNERAIVPQ